jgi:hypothetical protein
VPSQPIQQKLWQHAAAHLKKRHANGMWRCENASCAAAQQPVAYQLHAQVQWRGRCWLGYAKHACLTLTFGPVTLASAPPMSDMTTASPTML